MTRTLCRSAAGALLSFAAWAGGNGASQPAAGGLPVCQEKLAAETGLYDSCNGSLASCASNLAAETQLYDQCSASLSEAEASAAALQDQVASLQSQVQQLQSAVANQSTLIACSGVPTDVANDRDNCGDCGISCGSGTCSKGACILGACQGFQVFARGGSFAPQPGCSGSVRVLAVGGGGNGGAYPGSGGGSGYVSAGTAQLSGPAFANVGLAGQPSSFAGIAANGGQSGFPAPPSISPSQQPPDGNADGETGGQGGSSGGGKWCGQAGGAGGSNGSRGGQTSNLTGADQQSSGNPGSCNPLLTDALWAEIRSGAPSQGSPFPLGGFTMTTLAPGAGGGTWGGNASFEGGGGGGGVRISGSQTNGANSNNTGYGGQGYGAGAGGGPGQACNGATYGCLIVPQGAPGVVYVEWDH